MDQTTPPHQNVLQHQSERRESTNLDRGFRLSARGHPQKATRARTIALHNSTDSERLGFRENTVGRAVFKRRLQ